MISLPMTGPFAKPKNIMQTHQEDLDRVEKAYGVDSRVITAILLVETGLGTSTGNGRP